MLGVWEEGTHKNCVPQKNREGLGDKQGAVHHWHGCHNIMFQNQ
jgi:hypothetical protein